MSEVWSDLQDALSPYGRTPSDVEPDQALTKAAQEFESDRFFAGPFGHYVPDDGERLVPVTEHVGIERPTSAELIENEYNLLRDLSLAKNDAYGDSALHPVRIFSKADTLAAIDARIDDKLSRVKHAPEAFGEDVEADLIGYLVLRRIARRLAHA